MHSQISASKTLMPKAHLVISGFAVFFSLLFSFVVFPSLQEPFDLNIDPDRVGELASTIYEEGRYAYGRDDTPAIDRGPLYPYIIATIFWLVGGEDFTAVQVFQAFVHGLTSLLIFIVARRIFDRRIALVAQVLCATNPVLIWYTSRIWIETFLALTVAMVVWMLVLFVEKPTHLRSVFAGLAIAVASITKSILLLFPVFFGLLFVIHRRRESIPWIVSMMLSTVVVVVPWTVRNYNVSGYFVPVHTSLGLNMFIGDAIGEFWMQKPLSSIALWHLGAKRIDAHLEGTGYVPSDPPGDRSLAKASINHNLTHPLFLLKRTMINALTFWYLGSSEAKSLFLIVVQFPLVLCAVAGSIRLWRVKALIRPIVALLFYYVLCHSLIVGWARYSVPIIPLCCLFLSYAIFVIILKLRGASETQQLPRKGLAGISVRALMSYFV